MITGSITQRGGVSGGLTVGAGGTTDYNELENRPSINDNILEGNKNGHDLGLANYSDIVYYQLIRNKIFENNTGVPITSIELNDSINNYDLILISGICNTDNRNYRMTACYTPNELSAGLSGTLIRWPPSNEFLNYDVIDDRHLNVFQYNNIYINVVYGFKLGVVA